MPTPRCVCTGGIYLRLYAYSAGGGLATESLSAHIGQRIRWARGMVQIFRLDNPLFGKGLKLVQRVCYANAMLHFLSGIPRLIFLTAPLAFCCSMPISFMRQR